MNWNLRHCFCWIALTACAVTSCVLIGCSPDDPPVAQRPNSTDNEPANAVIEPPRESKPPPTSNTGNKSEPIEPADSAEDSPDEKEIAENSVVPHEASSKASFQDWPKPEVAFFITGRQDGYIEPCGCAGLENATGGLARRQSLLRQLRANGWDVVPIDVGNLIRRFGKQAEIKFAYSLRGLKAMDYRAVAFGQDDLRIGLALLNATEEIYNPFVAANAVVYAEDIVPPYRVIEAGGKRIGVTAVLADRFHEQLEGVSFQPAEAGLATAWEKLKGENCDLHVLLCHASLEETRRLAAKFPNFDIVVTAGGAGEPPWVPEKIAGSNATMVEVGTKGMYVAVVGVYDNEQEPLKYKKVALDNQLPDSREMLDLLHAYQRHLQNQIEQVGWEQGLEIRPVQHPSGRSFVGSAVCKDCHLSEYLIWKHGTDKKEGGKPGVHAIATHSLVEPPNDRSEIPRHFDPECLSCHVTGWNPQRYVPYKTGYLGLEDKLLHGNGCENCHGPGSEHVMLAEENDEDPRLTEVIERLSLDTARQSCLECHDLDNSPDFHKDIEATFWKYWSRIAH